MYETVNLHVVLGKKLVMTCWDLDHRMDGTRTRFVTREFIGDETMFVVSAPRSTPSMGRVFDDLSFKKSYRTFTTDVTNPYFHVDEDEKTAGRIGEFDLCALAIEETVVWPETRWKTLGGFHGRRH